MSSKKPFFKESALWADSFYKSKLEGTARYAGLLLVPAEGLGRGFFCPSGKNRAFHAVSAYFRPFLVFSSNLRNV